MGRHVGSTNNFISRKQFDELELGDIVRTRFMGKAAITSLPYQKTADDGYGNPVKNDCIRAKFITGPWSKGKWSGIELVLIRQQIAKIES